MNFLTEVFEGFFVTILITILVTIFVTEILLRKRAPEPIKDAVLHAVFCLSLEPKVCDIEMIDL